MLAYFPEIYPDELLYSVIARYALHTISPSAVHTGQTLFGRTHVVASFDLMGSLNQLAKRIPRTRKLTAIVLLKRTTLYLYYIAFEPPHVKLNIEQALLSGEVVGQHLRLGLLASKPGRQNCLKFCPECMAEAQSLRGEMYWRLSHQIDTVLICIEHEIPLQISTVCTDNRSRHNFIAANIEHCPVFPSHIPNEIKPHLLDIAKLSTKLLTEPSPPKSYETWSAYYRSKMLETGFVRSATKLNQEKLFAALQRFYGNSLVYFPEAVIEPRFMAQWLKDMLRKHRRPFHPMYHLLLQNFFNHQTTIRPYFGEGPWACLNPIVSHYDTLPIKNVKYHRDHEKLVATFACTCGYVYSLRVNVATGEYGMKRVLRFGPTAEPMLKRLVQARFSLQNIANILHMDPPSVIRLAVKLGIPIPWKVPATSTAKRRTTNSINKVTPQ